ncbi:beta-ketoacyl synthase N-terminal-like domain-containing protein [Flavobacterium tructae]|uniref:type I polyketide synthase n=1 Tax=Flavobacterium tructae TaxID=1114873 RepID=UPI002551FC8B|nr:type I polyketide synthase [Flavobacterium tructae]MDL2141592.1 beta-ketoacyl synthase N-terminal-like domain-containing protein [Flavobacterium tructae]
MENNIRKKDIAIVGISGKYPKSDNINEFWKHLMNGEELVHFYTDDELRAAGVMEKELANPDLIKAQASLEDPNSFDYSFFGYTRQEAMSMDPQVRMMHELVWLGLEDAGYNPKTYKDKIGLYLSASDNMNWRAYTMITNNDNVNSFYLNQISNKNFISTLISYNMNLRGPSYYVDTACSSSLVGIHQACRSLLMRECSIAIAGGVRVYSKVYKGHQYQEGMTNSKDGHCKAFDEDSSGIVSGEGAGVAVLKRLEDAIADKDQIYAVIRASVVNNDGNRKVGYTAPSISGQYECIKQAQQIADATPESITYIEAHGTGTKLGDPIEVEALNKSFEYNTNHQCALGSVKTNIGHLDSAAGITGFLKTTLALKNKMLPPSLHFKNPNPEINFKSGPFKVQTELAAWTSKDNQPLRAGVSSFGIGGNNAHVILQEAPVKEETAENNSYKLLRFSAQSVGALNAYQERLTSFLEENEKDNFQDMAYTLQVGRNQFKYNRFLVSNSRENAIETLKDPLSKSVYSGKLSQKRKIVFMCTGSGAQYLNMGKNLYEKEPYFKELIDKGFSIIKALTGVDVTKVLYEENSAAEKNTDINKNEFTQPIVFVFEYALAKLMMRWGITPDKLIGHSTGEYVAACLSEVFSFETGVKLVAKRALLMNKTPGGSMLSVSLSEEKIKTYLNDQVSLAVVNSPESCVLSGTDAAIDALIEILETEEILCSKLRISLGGHSFLMDSVLDEFREELEKVEFSAPKIPFVSNLTGQLISSEEAVSTQYWVDHLRHTVRFSDGLATLLKESDSVFIEVGPGNTLTTLFQQQQHNETSNNTAINLVRHPKQEINDQEHLCQKLGELWMNGIDINWETYYGEQKPYRVSMPGYVFNKTKLPVKVNPFAFLNFSGSEEGTIATPLTTEHYDDSEAFQDDLEDHAVSFVNYVPPSNETEEKLVEMWKSFFSKDEIGVLHDFFALGGNSLKGVTMLKLIQKRFDIEIKIKDFYQKSTIKELAAEIDMGLKLVTLQEESTYKSVMTI